MNRALGTLGDDNTLTMIEIVSVFRASEERKDFLCLRNTETSETSDELDNRYVAVGTLGRSDLKGGEGVKEGSQVRRESRGGRV